MGQLVMGGDELGWEGQRWDELGWAGMGWDGLSWCRAGLGKAGRGGVGVDCAVQGWDGWDGVGGSLMEVCWAIGSSECVSSSRGCCSWCSSGIIVVRFSLLSARLFSFICSECMTGAEQSHL